MSLKTAMLLWWTLKKFQQPAHNWLTKRLKSIDISWTFSDGLTCLISGSSETLHLKDLVHYQLL